MARFVFTMILFSTWAVAQDADLDKRVHALTTELRCLVCQNQTLAESNAPLAVDMRNQIREQMKAGASERDVVDFLVARYGDFVLYRPPVKATTLLLWGGPALLLALGAWLLVRIVRERRVIAEAPPLSAEERQRAEALLAGEAERKS